MLDDTYRAAAALGLRALCEEMAALARRCQLRLGAAAAAEGPLTARELDVLALISAGRSNQQIGDELYLSASTVRVHVSNILRKLQVGTRAQAAAAGYQRGLLQADPSGARATTIPGSGAREAALSHRPSSPQRSEDG